MRKAQCQARCGRACADELLAKGEPFDVVIANAGVMATPFGHTVDGSETNLVLSGPLFSINVVRKWAMLSDRTIYVIGPLHLTQSKYPYPALVLA